MSKCKNKPIKRLLAAFLSVVMVITGLQIGSTVEETAEAATEETITAFNTDPLPVTTFKWEYADNFTKANVCPNGAGSSISDSYIAYGGLNKIGYAKAESTELGTQKYNVNTAIKGENGTPVTQDDGVMTAADISVVSGLPYDSSTASKPWVKYKNVGYVEENGEIIQLDLKVTVTGWKIKQGTNQGKAFVEIGVCVNSDADSNYTHDKEAIGIWPSTNVKYLNLEYTFYKAGTDTEYSLTGQFSMVDLDAVQYFKIQNTGTSLLGGTSNISAITQSKDDYLIRDWYDKKDHITLSTSGTETTVSASSAFTDPRDYVTISDTGKSQIKSIEGSYKGGYVTFSFQDQSTVRFQFGNNGANNGATTNALGHYYYGITPYSIGAYDAPTPTKQVLTSGSTLSLDNLADSTTLNTGGREVTYVSSVVIPESIDSTCNYNAFSFTDTLNDVFDSEEMSVYIYQDSLSGKNVTSWFSNESSGNTLTFTAAEGSDTITENNRDFFGHTYYFVITTEIKSSLTTSDLDTLAGTSGSGVTKESSGYYKISNTCAVTAGVYNRYYNTENEKYISTTKSSETVYVYYAQPTITLTKQVKLYGADDSTYASSATVEATGDKVHYQVTLTNPSSVAAATNVSFTDKVPANLTIDTSSVKASISHSNVAYETLHGTTKGDYGQITISGNTISVAFNYIYGVASYKNRLLTGAKIVLEYDATVGATGENGAINTATATADNDISATASATVFNKTDLSWSPSVTLKKKNNSNGYEVPNGSVTYYVTATNDGDETLGSMTITDDSLPDSFTLSKVYVYYNNTGKLDASSISSSTKYWTKITSGEDGFTVSQNGNAWTVSVDDSAGGIPAGAQVRVFATYAISDDVQSGDVYTNTAQVTGTGLYSGLAVSADDSSSVTIEEPILQVTKTADKSSYTLGETAHYTIEVTQANITHYQVHVSTIYDLFDVKTSETLDPICDITDNECALGDDSAIQNLKVVDGWGSLYSGNEVSGSSFWEIMEDDGCDVDVEIDDDQRGYAAFISSTFYVKNPCFLITYDLPLTNEALVEAVNEPGTVTNTVIVTSSDADAVYAVNTITVESTDTTLDVDKQVRLSGDSDATYEDSVSILEGQKAEYVLKVTNTGNKTAENLTIKDVMTQGGDDAKVPDDYEDLSIIVCDDEGTEIGSADSSNEKASCFSIEDDGWSLTDYYDLPVGYSLKITYTGSYAVSDATYINTATASADNAEEVSDTASVTVSPPVRTTVNVEKKILASDINFANGDPIFVLNLTGTDEMNNTISKHKVVQFTEDYVTANTDSDGYVSITSVFDDLLPGTYTVSEDASLRYRLKSVDGEDPSGVIKTATDSQLVIGTVATNADKTELTFSTSNQCDMTCKATFINEKYEWQYLTETDHVINSFNTSAE